MNYLALFFILIMLFIILNNYYGRNKGLVSLQCPIDNRYYMVKDDDNKFIKLKILSKANNIILQIFNKLKNSEYNSRPEVKKLYNTYNPNALYENVDNDYTAYSLNKGQEIRVCLVDPKTKEVINDINTLLFVLIHELAHIMTKEIGHPPIFWENMSFLLEFSINNNLYKYVDYSRDPVMYCGVNVNKTPFIQ